jgi:hypothetical protein
LALDFTTASLDARVTFTRTGNTATVINSNGVIAAINADLPRFDFDPTTLVCRGLLIEEARTNDLLNSLIDGTDLATQLVTVTAAARTLSFYGTGTVVLSGAHSATVVGAGAYPTRTTLTFTPIAGVLTLTVTGTVQFAQLELGAFATSFIPTDGTTKTRNADLATMTGTNFSDWFNASEGSFVAQANYQDITSGRIAATIHNTSNTQANRYTVNTGTTLFNTSILSSNAVQVSINNGTKTSGVSKLALAYKLDDFAFSSNGNAAGTDTSGLLPVDLNQLQFGGRSLVSASFINGHVQKFMYFPQRLTNAEIQAFSK